LAEVKAQSVSQTLKKKLDPEREAEILAARVCYYYPNYSLYEARRLPHKDVRLLIQTAECEKAAEYYALTQIASAAYTDMQSGYAKLSKQFKEIMDT
jgi:hypothetical protein